MRRQGTVRRVGVAVIGLLSTALLFLAGLSFFEAITAATVRDFDLLLWRLGLILVLVFCLKVVVVLARERFKARRKAGRPLPLWLLVVTLLWVGTLFIGIGSHGYAALESYRGPRPFATEAEVQAHFTDIERWRLLSGSLL